MALKHAAAAVVVSTAEMLEMTSTVFLKRALRAYATHNDKARRALPDGTKGKLSADATFSPWVHQRYSPVKLAGTEDRVALMSFYGEAVKAGSILPCDVPDYTLRDGTVVEGSNRIPTWVDAVVVALADKAIRQAPAKGGYILAVTSDIPARDAKSTPAKMDKAGISALLQ